MKTYKQFKSENLYEFADIIDDLASRTYIKHGIKLKNFLGKDFDYKENEKNCQ